MLAQLGQFSQGRLPSRTTAPELQPASRQAEAVAWRGRQALALPGNPLRPATAHKLQGGGLWPTGSEASLASAAQGSALCSQPSTSLAGISVLLERANHGVCISHVAQSPLLAHTCPLVSPLPMGRGLNELLGICSLSYLAAPKSFQKNLLASFICARWMQEEP